MTPRDIDESLREYTGEYGPEVLQQWTDIAERHHWRDTIFLKTLVKFFRPGKMLELGAATGNISEILLRMGFDIIPSDLSPSFVAAMRSKGMDARLVDSQDICGSIEVPFDTIITSALSPFITHSPNSITIRKTYESIHASLRNEGRLIFIFPQFSSVRHMLSKFITARAAYGNNSVGTLKKKYATARTHVDIIRQMHLFEIKKLFRHQVLPTSFYTEGNMKLLNAIDCVAGRALGQRAIFVLEKV